MEEGSEDEERSIGGALVVARRLPLNIQRYAPQRDVTAGSGSWQQPPAQPNWGSRLAAAIAQEKPPKVVTPRYLETPVP